jgi:thiamine biosynthesis lipoprotein
MSTLTQEVFDCMGNTTDLTVVGDPSLLGVARVRLKQLEQRWSRFISSSDICALNQSKGAAISVHPDTITLVRYLVDAQRLTNRFFDPTLLPSLVQLGYARSMTNASLVTQLDGSLRWGEPLAATSIDFKNRTVTLPIGLTLDPGGLGKGLAADIVASELRELGAEGVCISLGGDIRCAGTGPIAGRR